MTPDKIKSRCKMCKSMVIEDGQVICNSMKSDSDKAKPRNITRQIGDSCFAKRCSRYEIID